MVRNADITPSQFFLAITSRVAFPEQIETIAHAAPPSVSPKTPPRGLQQLCTMLSTILPSRSKTTSPSGSSAAVSRQAAAADAVDAATASLNHCLDVLYEVFPNGDVDYFRQLLSSTSEESRLYVVAEILLKGKKGPARRATRDAPKLEPWQKFRSMEYQQAVRTAL
jgi:hypothetical protein